MLNNNAEWDNQDFEGKTHIHLTTEVGHLGVLKLILNTSKVQERQRQIINALYFANETPLYFSAKYGHSWVIKYMIDHGADVNGKFTMVYTPLLIETKSG